MNRIESVLFLKDHRCFKEGQRIVLAGDGPITLLVGDQGCGKSTLLSLISKPNKGIAEVILADRDRTVSTAFFDTEKGNPRMKGRVETAEDVMVRMHSHGQIIRKIMESVERFSGKTILIDEPEAGLSIRSQYKLLRDLLEAASRNQLIVSTHSIILIRAMEKVLSLEHGRWMDSEEFIETQTGDRA